MTLNPHPWMALVARTNHFQSYPPDLGGRERGWRLSQLTLANDFINHAYVMKPPKKPKRMGFGELPA